MRKKNTRDGEHLNIAKHKEYLLTMRRHMKLVNAVREEMRMRFFLTQQLLGQRICVKRLDETISFSLNPDTLLQENEANPVESSKNESVT